MAETTNIAWAHATWSPWRGCAKVSPGCDHCYAEAMSHRNPAVLGEWGTDGVRVVNKDWNKPLQWDRAAAKAGERRRVFPSLCDWLEDRPDLDKPLAQFLSLIDATPNLDWLLLTKRPELFRKRLRAAIDSMPKRGTVGPFTGPRWNTVDWLQGGEPSGRPYPPNVWHIASVEDQARADERIGHLLAAPAAVRGLSVEPLLGPIDLTPWLASPSEYNVLKASRGEPAWDRRPRISWVIAGGESGPNARPCDIAWIRSIVRQCRESGVPVFVKQLGANVVASNDAVADWFGSVGHLDMATTERFQGATGRIRGLRHPKGGDPMEWPEDLRVQEFPAVKGVVA